MNAKNSKKIIHKQKNKKKNDSIAQFLIMYKSVVVPKNDGPIPNSIVTRLIWKEDTAVMSGASTFLSRYRLITYPYDINPAILTTAVSYLPIYLMMYNRHKVIKVRVKTRIINQTATTVTYTRAVTNEDVSGSLSTSTAVLDLAELSFSDSRDLSAAGGMDRASINTTYDIPQITGRPQEYLTSQSFDCEGTNPPTDLVYLFEGVVSSGNLTAGVWIRSTYILTVCFFDKKAVFS